MFAWTDINTRGVGRPLRKPSTLSRICITVPNPPKPSLVYIRQCKHGKGVLCLKRTWVINVIYLLCFCCFIYTTLVIEITLHNINLPVTSFVRLVRAAVNKSFKKSLYIVSEKATTISLNLSTTVSIDQVIVLSLIESGLRVLVFHAGVSWGVVLPPSPKNDYKGGCSLLRLYRSVPGSRAIDQLHVVSW